MHYAELHTFTNPALLEQARTHSSYANEHPGTPSNQRLEFLGDAVLEMIVSELLVARYPDWDEGNLSKARALVVDTDNLAAVSAALGLPDAIRGGRGLVNELGRGGKVWADLFEALIGAIYQDAGLGRAREVVTALLAPATEGLTPEMLKDGKSWLQEHFQGSRRPAPTYAVVERSGPDHAPRFVVEVRVDGDPLARGEGRSRKLAELDAAERARAAIVARAVEERA